MRQQLELWARQAAVVRAGSLQPSCRLALGAEVEMIYLSPRADWVAVYDRESTCDVALVPVTGGQQRLAVRASAEQPSPPLSLPGSTRDQFLQTIEWAPSGHHMVIVHTEYGAPGCCLHVSTFQGPQLVGSFTEPLTAGEDFHVLHVSEEAFAWTVIGKRQREQRVLASTAQGAVVGRSPWARLGATAPLEGGRLLCASSAGDRLYIYSPTCMLVGEVGLPRAPAGMYQADVRFSCWGGAASVLLVAHAGTAHALVVVDLVRQRVRHRMGLPGSASGLEPDIGLAQGAHAVALELRAPIAGTVRVVATSGSDVGRELFSCPGSCAAWDAAGRFLAVGTQEGGAVIYEATGRALASWPNQQLDCLYWLADSAGLVIEEREPEGQNPYLPHPLGSQVCRLGSWGPESAASV